MAQITIKLDVEIHDRLKESARRDSRTVSGQIDYLLKNRIILEDIAEKLQETPAGSEKKSLNPAGSWMVKIRTPQVIDREIAELDREELEELEFVQDEDVLAERHAEFENKRIALREEKAEFFNNLIRS